MFLSHQCIGLICLLLVATGCARPEKNVATPPLVDQGIDALPAHQSLNTIDTGLDETPVKTGSVFVYSDSNSTVEQWEAVKVGEHNIVWRGTNGQTRLTTLSPILPALRWSGKDESGRRIITRVQGRLHPMAVGKRMEFHVETLHTRPPGNFSGDWSCEVTDQLPVKVPAGLFDTWQILCKVNGLEYLLANYSDQLGNNVRTISVKDDNSVFVRQLASSSLLKNKDENDESKK